MRSDLVNMPSNFSVSNSLLGCGSLHSGDCLHMSSSGEPSPFLDSGDTGERPPGVHNLVGGGEQAHVSGK